MQLVEEPPTTSPGPRERALDEGVASLGDADLLAILLGTGLAGRPVGLVAAGLLERVGGLEALGRLGPLAIAEHPGVGPTKAARIAASMELGRRALQRATRSLGTLNSSAAVHARLGPVLSVLSHEEMWIVALDAKNHARSLRKIAQGGLHSCTIQPTDALRAALYEAASAFILVHNHPSGDELPSPEDLVFTRRIADASYLLGVPLVDHVICAPSGRYTSMLDLGILGA